MNFWKYNGILIITFLMFGCKSNNITIKYDEESRYEDINKEMIADKSKDNVIVYLEDYFNGEVKGYIGNKLIFNKKIETEESLGTTEENFFYNYANDTKLPKIKIESDMETAIIEIEKDYKIIYVYKHKNKWEIIYSNIYATYE